MTIHTIPWNKRYVRAIDTVFLQTWLDTYQNHEYNIKKIDIIEHFWKLAPRLERRKIKLESVNHNEIRIMAKEWNKIIGVCVAKKDNKKNILESIYILWSHQWKGIWRKLWGDVIEFFDKRLPVVVEVASYNQNAIAFYKKLGFYRHTWEHHNNDFHNLKNGKSIPIITMILSHI